MAPALAASRRVRDDEPVTTEVTRRIKPGHEAAYEAFLEGIGAAARQSPGFLGVEIFRPPSAAAGDYRIVYRFDSRANLQRWLDSPDGGGLSGRTPHDEYVRDNFVGTVEKVAADVQAYVDAGCQEFVLWFRDYPSTESLERFITEVAPKVR